MSAAEDQSQWWSEQLGNWTRKLEVVTPSQWAERNRYLPQTVTSMPGYYRFAVTPYLQEIVDCLGVDSPVREVSVMKGVQIGYTSGVTENAIGYFISHVKTAPVMFVTADSELAQLRLDSYILPMLQNSNLGHLITSADETNARRTGNTRKKIEWVGGGWLVPFGAQNANKLRSLSIRALFEDENDGWPTVVGKDGDPETLVEARTKAYEDVRKICRGSTPLLKGLSRIEKKFLEGDQRHYLISCLNCNYQQTLGAQRRDPSIGLYGWRHTNPDTGEVTGFVWETEGGLLVPGSVRWLCHKCGREHVNDDKTRLLDPNHGAEWLPTAKAVAPDVRSYHIPGLLSPVGMYTWESCVRDFLAAWDVQQNEVKDQEKLQVFYNNVLGETYEIRGEKLTTQQVSKHRRSVYRSGEIPNRFAKMHTGSPVLFAACTVDVHKNNLAVARWGFCRETRLFILDYQRFEGEVENPEDAATWGRLEDAIGHTYKADDGKNYGIELALIDAGYLPDQVQTFCARMGPGVYPIVGRGRTQAGGEKHFKEASTATNTSFVIGVDLYKDRWGSALRRGWSGDGIQPSPFLNAPADLTDKQIKELTVEKRVAMKRQTTGEILYYSWHRPNGVDNELWDLLVYANAAHDILATAFCREELGVEDVSEEHVKEFWDVCEQHGLFFFE